MRRFCLLLAPWMGLVAGLSGCHHPTISAVSLNPEPCGPECDGFWGVVHHCLKSKEEGIPFYLPKPLLIVAKNFRNIEDAKVGLTDTAPIPNAFDDQGKYADLNARASFNFADPSAGAAPPDTTKSKTQSADPSKPANPADNNVQPVSTATKSGAYTYSQNAPNVTPHDVPDDGLAPNTFYTYQIIFVPDMTQKYGLKVNGGVGEIRAAMNLVNGWQFTGLGPYYMKDSSTAQDVMASGIAARLGGQAVQDVLKGVAGLTGKVQGGGVSAGAPQVQSLSRSIEELRAYGAEPQSIPEYAEIYVYEARLGPDGQMEWHQIVDQKNVFKRHYLGQAKTDVKFAPASTTVPTPQIPGAPASPQGQAQSTRPGSPSLSTLPANSSFFFTSPTGGLDPNVVNLLGQTFGAPIISAPVVAGQTQAAIPAAATAPAAATPTTVVNVAPSAAPSGHGLFHHDKKRRGTAKSTVTTLDQTTVNPLGTVVNQSQPPTSRPPTAPVVNAPGNVTQGAGPTAAAPASTVREGSSPADTLPAPILDGTPPAPPPNPGP